MNNKVKFLRGTSNEYAVAVKDSDTIYFTTDDGKLYIGDKEVSGDGSITIDDTLSDTSENPVQNKVVKQAIDNKADKTVATTSTDGLMSAEDKGKLDAFEITTTGGKLHDKDIATTDLIPTTLPANGGNADTVDGMHADDFATSVNPTIIGGIKVVRPSSTSTIQSIFSISDTIRIRNLDSETSQTNNYADIVVTTSGVFTEKAVDGVWQGRKELLTSTCVTGTSTIVDSNNFVSVNFGFTPSAVLYAVYDSKTDVDNNYRLAQEFNSTGFVAETRVAPVVGGTETFSYIAFR